MEKLKCFGKKKKKHKLSPFYAIYCCKNSATVFRTLGISHSGV